MNKHSWITIAAIALMLHCGGGLHAQEAAEKIDEGGVIEEGFQDIETQNAEDERGDDDTKADLKEIAPIVEAEEIQEIKQAEEVPEEEKKEPEKPRVVDMSQRITLDLRNMGVNDALTYISLRSGANIVTSKSVTGRVTLQLKDVSIHDVFDITLLTNNLAYETRGDIYYIMTALEYEARYGKSFGDIRKVKMHQLKYAIPEKAFDLLDTLKSKIGRILVDQESGTILMIDTQEKIEEMESALLTLEKKSDINVFDLQYAVAVDVEEQLRGELDEKSVGSIWADERSNQVVIQAFPDRMEDIRRIIAALDRKTREVLIDAKIIKVDFQDTLTTGIEWEGMFNGLVGGGFLGSYPLNPVDRFGASTIGIEGIDYLTIPDADNTLPAVVKQTYAEQVYFGKASTNTSWEAVFKFLGTLGEAKLLSNPKLAVINNQEARIHVGRKEAYITTTTTSGSTTTTTAEDVNFVDVGIQLSVTPTINADGFVTMKIKPEVSSVVDVLITPSGNQIPIIDTSLAETTVMVENNATIIIGGLRRDEETESSERIPFLGDLPWVGNLFKSQIKQTERSELLVMITPHIVDGSMLTTGEVDPGEEGAKEFKDYETYRSVDDDIYGPEFGKLEYKSFRD